MLSEPGSLPAGKQTLSTTQDSHMQGMTASTPAQRVRPAPEEPGAGGADQAVPVVVPHDRLLARSVLRSHTHTQLTLMYSFEAEST
jgi:hypothetical protein